MNYEYTVLGVPESNWALKQRECCAADVSRPTWGHEELPVLQLKYRIDLLAVLFKSSPSPLAHGPCDLHLYRMKQVSLK
jgi:hypothetical protein